MSRVSRLRRCGVFVLLAASVALFQTRSFAQQLTATLSGTVYDQTGAIVPNGTVVLTNELNKTTRTTTANSDGYFTFTAIQPGTYDVKITSPGFRPWEQTNIVLNQGDNRSLPNIALAVGQTTQQVEVVAPAASLAPLSSGEVSTTLNQQMVSNISIESRDAGELLKLMPGAAPANGINQGSSFNTKVVSTGNGPVGAYTVNGQQPYGSMAYMLDGANLVDPGNMGTQIANINQDMTSEVKVLTNGYDAEYAKGPVIFEAYSKSGGAQFHGEAYLYARNGVLNSVDSYTKSQGGTAANEHYYYPGANIGGPVLLPFTKFNRNRDKLFFWFGYENMRQQPQATPFSYFVPTPEMKSGNFSPAYLQSLGPQVAASYPVAVTPPCGSAHLAPGCTPGATYSTTNGLSFPGGMIPVNAMDPNGIALLKLYPSPNVDPATHGGNNYQFLSSFPTNRWEQTEKIDYNISETTKLTGSYAQQDEADYPDNGMALWWAPQNALPYPSPLTASTNAKDVMINLTHTFSPTLTNETVFTFAHFLNPILPQNPSAIERSTIGFNVPELNGQNNPQIPSIRSQCCGPAALAGWDPQGSFFQNNSYGGAFIGMKNVPAIYDNLSKVSGTHTMKFGVYWDANINEQSSSGETNGTYNFDPGGPSSTGNTITDLLIGHAQQYTQASALHTDNLTFHQWSLYGQDSWKMTKRLTINYGLRLDHMGQWYPTGPGVAVWDPYTYDNGLNPPFDTGITWHAINSLIPQSGFRSPLFYPDPRVGIAFDIFGNGKTVLRGGFALFRYQLSQNSIQSASELPLGLYTINSATGLDSLAQAATTPLPANGANVVGQSPNVLQMGAGQVPWTRDWNVTIDQQLPWRSLVSMAYVGSQSGDELIQSSGNGSPWLGNPNLIPLGAFFGPDPNPKSPNYGQIVSTTASNFKYQDYFPIANYQGFNFVTHGSYANYNALQVQWQKQSGPVTFLVNYAFSKALGIRDGETVNGSGNGANVWPYSAGANYGVLAYDHTHIFNSAYIFSLPSPIHHHALLQGVVNGWQLSGVTQITSGAPLQPASNQLNANFPGTYSSTTELGSNGPTLTAALVCDPRSNLKSGQYFNPSCFAPPAPGTEGSIVWPYIKTPAYFDSDLSLYKNFKWGESRSFQFRFSAYNFLNHPLPQFGKQGNNDVSLNFNNNGTLSQTNLNTFTTGYPAFTVGNREVELAAKFMF